MKAILVKVIVVRCPCSVEYSKINFEIKFPTGQIGAPI
ncbi:unnamed protein product [Paramecium primaurelia]|uniref:Uncharacterized protein n=1 Tax=Paramecium primaurelia TaxID=5886 RepID=A0A8S1NYR8_PARPR|nr:unnamed protein product [Paramecium primaurelia]